MQLCFIFYAFLPFSLCCYVVLLRLIPSSSQVMLASTWLPAVREVTHLCNLLRAMESGHDLRSISLHPPQRHARRHDIADMPLNHRILQPSKSCFWTVAMDKSSALQLTKRCLPHLGKKGQHRVREKLRIGNHKFLTYLFMVSFFIMPPLGLRPGKYPSICDRWFSHAFPIGISPRSWKSDWDWKCEAKESVPWFLASSFVFRSFGDKMSGSMDLWKN